jgi:hypothetical protein
MPHTYLICKTNAHKLFVGIRIFVHIWMQLHMPTCQCSYSRNSNIFHLIRRQSHTMYSKTPAKVTSNIIS